MGFFQDSRGVFHWEAPLVLAFAVAFLVVGVMRVVEFSGLGLSERNRKIAAATHIAGCVVFSLALALLAIDIRQTHRAWMNALFFSGVLFFFPGQGLVALKRRQLARIEQARRDQAPSSDPQKDE